MPMPLGQRSRTRSWPDPPYPPSLHEGGRYPGGEGLRELGDQGGPDRVEPAADDERLSRRQRLQGGKGDVLASLDERTGDRLVGQSRPARKRGGRVARAKGQRADARAAKLLVQGKAPMEQKR